ncbi:MAG: bifunctional malic enzyme oxidoreductase/phosphotransacetylase [Chloroflexota bacterium]|nr:MAG: bifunctional malic enzyme oxidoreductase/phosphotransacetylase [Chloroflexota bacterium]
MAITKQDALAYHKMGRPGKIEVTPTKPLTTQRDLSLAYSPGVAEAVLEVERDPLTAYELTAKSNLVAVVSNGTAILGLGDRGALASKPVMEGKGVLFKRFADVDVFDIEIDASTVEEIISAVRAIAPTFGGINLEDIKAPECFEVEERLKAELPIPVFHDDQHGTAIISGAALLNACEITGRKLADLRIVVSGAGASAIATAKFYVSLGVRRENIIMLDSKGVIYQGREGVNKYKAEFAVATAARTLEEALDGADVFLGLSVKGALKPEWIKKMAKDPIIFALANPDPEIMPEEALAARPDAIIGTGRSDYPNQINNVLGFPFIFRGALDVYAQEINEDMKMAASKALAALAHEDVPDSVLTAYGRTSIKFGREYLIPKPLDPRVLLWVSPAVAEAAIKSGMARREINIEEYRQQLIRRQGFGRMLRSSLINKAKAGPKQRIVFPEGDDPKIIRAAARVEEEGIGTPILLGPAANVRQQIEELGLHFSPQIIEPLADEIYRPRYEQTFYELRQRKGVSKSLARRLMTSATHFGLMMLKHGDADAYLNGITRDYPEVVRPALQIFHTRSGATRASGVYIMIVKGRVYLFTDATVNIDPDAETLSEIAILAADFARTLEIEPQVAMLSFSNFGSTPHPSSDKVRHAVELVRQKRPDIPVEGEMQADTAVVTDIVEQRYPFSRVRDANVLVFPDLESANIAYKLLARLGGAEAIGPILLGVGAPVHVLQAGDDVEDIVAMAAVAAVDAQSR